MPAQPIYQYTLKSFKCSFQLALLLLFVCLCLRHVGPLGQVLAVGHQALLVQLPPPLRREGRLVVLHDRAQLLLVSLLQPGDCICQVEP